MESLYRLKDLLCDEIDDIVKKNDITPVELDRAYKVVDVIKDIYTIEAMNEVGEDEWDEEASYRGGRGGYSRARRGGNYSYRRDGDYSRAHRNFRMSYDDPEMSKEHMMQKIAEMQRKVEQM